MKAVIVSFFLLVYHSVVAFDSTYTLSESQFIAIVRSYHPIAKQSTLLVERSKSELTAARAGFDPSFYINSDRKTFDGKNYYQYTNPELKIPTWFGVEVKAGLENNLGNYTNPELSLGKSSYLGISVPVAKNLLMDKRRAVLQQAKIFKDQSRAEQALIINDLLLDAISVYWQWVMETEIYSILDNVVKVNEARLRLVKLGFQQGDRPAIDTTEALAQLQSFIISRNSAWLNSRNAAFEMSNYLWTANDSPYVMPEYVSPDSSWKSADLLQVEMPKLNEILTLAREQHPKLIAFDYKLQGLDIEKRLKFQNLLPVVNLRYNILNEGYNVFKNSGSGFYQNNYKFGFDIGLPLRLSQGRGEYKIARIKIQETGLDKMLAVLEVNNKVKAYFNEMATLKQQVTVAEEAVMNYNRLVWGEETRFKIGESSLFLLNARENKLLEARQKMVELKTKFYKSQKALQWSAGQLK